jgi:diguanylate cyclase (GGDEF)-like protein
MTLSQILLILVSATLFILLLGNLLLNIHNTQNYLQKQLYSNASNTATSLALSLSSVVKGHDLVTASSMIDAVFDDGFYKSLIYRDVKGKTLIKRQAEENQSTVPDWFVDFIHLRSQAAKAQVVNGWRQLGTLEVISDTDYAYKELWSALKAQLAWFIVVALVATLLMKKALSWILKPLGRIEAQAESLANHNFDVRSPEPNTRELRQVARVMNSMAEKLGVMFNEQVLLIEQLRQDKFRDELTGLGNRLDFDQRLKAELSSEQSATMGCLILIHVGRFAEYNQQNGRQAGDELLKSVANRLREACRGMSGSFLARRNGSEFAAFIPGLLTVQSESFAESLLKKLTLLRGSHLTTEQHPFHIGMAFSKIGLTTVKLLYNADLSLRQAQEMGVDGWRSQGEQTLEKIGLDSATAWQNIIKQSILTGDISQFYQPVYHLDSDTIMYYQVLSRLFVKGEWTSASIFIPMAERFGLLPELDSLMVQQTLLSLPAYINTQKENRVVDLFSENIPGICLTLSAQSLLHEGFIDKLVKQLKAVPEFCPYLLFELPEQGLLQAMDEWKDFIKQVEHLGCRFSIDRMGVAGVPFTYLDTIPLEALKVDRSYIRDIQQFPDKQFFIRSLMQIAHTRGIKVIAVGVENKEELTMIQQLQMDGVLGYLLARPQKSLV